MRLLGGLGELKESGDTSTGAALQPFPYEKTRDMMKAYSAGRLKAEASLKKIERLGAMLRQGGAMTTDTCSARVIAGLASAGVFRAGAVLVGTQAFIAMGNLLGVRWESGLRTQDIDAATTRVLEIAVPQTEAHLPRESLNNWSRRAADECDSVEFVN